MNATLLLCDAAQVDPAQKLHVLGAAWSVTSTPLPPHTVAVILHVEWTETNIRHTVHLELVTADGHVVMVQGDDGPEPVVDERDMEVGRPPGAPPGTTFAAPMTLALAPGLPLEPGGYSWRLTVNGEHRDEWVLPFQVHG